MQWWSRISARAGFAASGASQAVVESAPWGFRVSIRALRPLPLLLWSLSLTASLPLSTLAPWAIVSGHTLHSKGAVMLSAGLLIMMFGASAVYCLWGLLRVLTTREVVLADSTGITSTVTSLGRTRSLHYPLKEIGSVAACRVDHLPGPWYYADGLGLSQPGSVVIFRYQGGYGATSLPFDDLQAQDVVSHVLERYQIPPDMPRNLPLSDEEQATTGALQQFFGPTYPFLYEALRQILVDADLTGVARSGPGFPYWYAYEAGALLAFLPACSGPEPVDSAIREAFRRCTDTAFEMYRRWEQTGPDTEGMAQLPEPDFLDGFPADLGVWIWLAWTDAVEAVRAQQRPDNADPHRTLLGRDDNGPYATPLSNATH
ncbi:MAG: hypothetical protein OEW11_07880 [Nitrospirota bacterium]|nr:hypothetical protein [Nitrospirota bacterium]